ncbi:hypothetical protein M569_02632, partial [Genlisea aurea]
MAVVAPPADQAVDMMQKLTLDTQPNSIEIPTPTKKQSADSNNMANGVQSVATTLISDMTDKAVSYQPNGFTPYYGGYDGSERDLAKFAGHEGVEMGAGAYGENAPLLYHHSYGYSQYPPYSPAVSPVPTLPHDAQLYGAQQYHYPSPYFQSMAPNNGPYTANPAALTKGEMTASAPSDQSSLPADSTNSKSNGIANNEGPKPNNGTVPSRPAYLNTYNMSGSYGPGSFTGAIPGSGFQDPRFAYDGLHSPVPWMDSSTYYSDGQRRLVTSSSMTASLTNVNRVPPYRNQNFQPQMGLHQSKPLSGLNAASSGYMNRMYPNKFYGQYGNTYGSGLGYGCYDYASRINGRGWMSADSKYKPRVRGNGIYVYGTESLDCLNELNRGPRTKNSKNTKSVTPVAMVVKGQSLRLPGTTDNEKSTATPDREEYNRQDFSEQYADAKFFVIKSYSEDDVHKSIKYNIWASTDNGNKKLDAAYQEAEQKAGGCPVFLFFSVNASGQFVGVAEMIGPVDFNKSVEYWQQDKWIGCFPVKWHIVKDVPNGLLKHIILENNENKPVTNSRDTQEVKLEQGLKMLKIFKEHPSKQCVLDDFDFYEERQKKIQEKKVKQRQLLKQDQTWEGKTTAENVPND